MSGQSGGTGRQGNRTTGNGARLWSTAFDRELRRVIDSIRLGELDEALRVASDVKARAKEQGDEYASGRALMFASEIALLQGDAAVARSRASEAERLFKKIRLGGGVSRVCRLLSEIARAEGNPAEAWRRMDDALAAADSIPPGGVEGEVRQRALFECHVAVAGLLTDDNRVDEALDRLRAADQLSVELTDPMLLGDLALARGRVEWLLDPKRGLELLTRAERIYVTNRLTLRAAAALEAQGDCLLSVGELAKARDAYGRAHALAAEARAAHALARLEGVLSGLDERLRAAEAIAGPGRLPRTTGPLHAGDAKGPGMARALLPLLDPRLRFQEFCQLLAASVVADYRLSDAAAIVQDLGGGSLAVIASEPAELAPDALFALLNRGGARFSAVIAESPKTTLELRSDRWGAREPAVRELLDVLVGIAALRLGDDVAAEFHGAGSAPWPETLNHGMVVASLEMQAVLAQVYKAAQADYTVLITGESGTGKERVARAVHALSRRAEKPFLVTNCAAMPADLVESKLFGHRKGAFTGASADNAGLFRSASGGTLFLDEVGELPLALQPKLLRALDVGEIEPVGANAPVKVDARVLAATNRDLERESAAGRFRADLYHRLNVIAIAVPPLRSRPADILPLARHFVEMACKAKSLDRVVEIHPSAEAMLRSYHWPGNVRELSNTIFRTLLLNDYQTIREQHIAPWSRPVAAPPAPSAAFVEASGSFDEMMNDAARKLLSDALRASNGSRSDACKRLGITRGRFYRVARQIGLALDDNGE